MYALVNGQELLLGPVSFNYRMINSVLEEELEVVDGLNVCVGIPPVCGVFLVDQDPGVMVTVDFSIEKVM